MSLRAIYIIPAAEETEVPVFYKYFHTVEARCKSRSGQLYVKIPAEREFVKLLFTEIGIKRGGSFVQTRDYCDKEFSNPAYQLKTDWGILWPVIVMDHNRFIYCAIPFEETYKTNHQSGNMKLTLMATVTTCLEVLIGVSHCVDNSSSQGKVDTLKLLKYVSCAFPFGRPVCCTSTAALNFTSSSWRGKTKQPAWNPLQYKGKSHVALRIKEEIRCVQFNQRDVGNPVDVYGTVTCTAEAEGVSPEISLVLMHSSESKCGLLVNTCVASVENISPSSTRLRFHPVKSQNLCIYKMTGVSHPPIHATFSMKVKEDIANISVQLKLKNDVKNGFQKLEVHIPFNCKISAVRSHCSQGTLIVGSQNTLIWNIGSKLPSKTLEASLQARAKLKRKESEKPLEVTPSEQFHANSDKPTVLSAAPLSETVQTPYASVIFTIMDYVYSGCKIDPQSVVVSTASKVSRSVSCECSSGLYNIWNNENSENVVDDSLLEEFSGLLETT